MTSRAAVVSPGRPPVAAVMLARDNPFRAARLDALAFRPRGTSWPALMRRVAEHGRRGAIVGPEGHGKSTLLRALGHRLETAGLPVVAVRARRESRGLTARQEAVLAAAAAGGAVALVDGADALGGRAWRRVRRAAVAAGGLLVTTHRPGRLPTIHHCVTDLDLLRELVAELAGPGAVSEEMLDDLFRRHHGNVRE
ncbi:MAG: hypothetical protein ACYTJ0_21290, partial [Planctomycetota bacterium]